MRILLDARYLDGTFTGIGTYSAHLARALAELDPSNEYLVLVRPGFKPGSDLPARIKWLKWGPAPVSFSTLYRLGRYVDTLGVDLMHSLFPLAPLFMRTPLIVTVHDLQPFIDPEFSARRPIAIQGAYDFFYRFTYPAVMRKAKWVLNVSYYTRDTVAEIFPEFIPKLIVVHSGLDPAMFSDPPDDFELVGAEFQLAAPYLLYYGSTRPNKNLPNLLRGFAHYIRESGDDRTELVMILKKDRFFRDLPRIARAEGIADRVRFLDQVSPGEQRTILSNALGFLFPSKYEGFGFPALEALANRVPLLAAKSGALEEVCGDAAVYVDPDDTASIGHGIELLLESPRHTEARRERGRARAEQFSWKEAAARVLDVYRLLC